MDEQGGSGLEPDSATEGQSLVQRIPKVIWVVVAALFLVSTVVVIRLHVSTALPREAGQRGWYHSNIENVRFKIPEGWVTTSDTLSLPGGFTPTDTALVKRGSPCVIMQVKDPPRGEWANKHISFADLVYSDYTQFDSDWYIASTSDAAQYSFSDQTRQYIPGEFRQAHNSRNDPFVLFMADGSAVPDGCNSDFNALLKTVEPYFEHMALTATSTGTLAPEKIWDELGGKGYEHLVFVADGSDEKKEVMRIPTGTWTGTFAVSGGKLYVPSQTAITAIDPFSGESAQIPGTEHADTYISSLYVQDDTAYFLMGSSTLGTCLAGYHPCPADFYSVPLAGGTPTLIAHSSIGGAIVGYVKGEDAWYLTHGWGDAGCISLTFVKIVGGAEVPAGKFGDCYGASDADKAAYQQMKRSVDAITAKAQAAKTSASAIRVENGALEPAPPSDVDATYAQFLFDKQ